MIFSTAWFGSATLWSAAALWLPLTAFAAWRARAVFGQRQAACVVAMAIMALLWLAQARVDAGHLAGIGYHLLAVNLAAMMLGGAAAWCVGSLVAALLVLGSQAQQWSVIPLTALATVLPACAVNSLFRRAAAKWLPDNVFIYIFVCGFFAAFVGMQATGITVSSLLAAAGVFPVHTVWHDIFPIFFLLGWAEAFLNGLATAILVAFAPAYLATFDDERFLKNRDRIW